MRIALHVVSAYWAREVLGDQAGQLLQVKLVNGSCTAQIPITTGKLL
jgi:hypothetical protein